MVTLMIATLWFLAAQVLEHRRLNPPATEAEPLRYTQPWRDPLTMNWI
jgi:hypothetical protein